MLSVSPAEGTQFLSLRCSWSISWRELGSSGQSLALPQDWRVAKNTLLSLGMSVHRDRLKGVESEAVRLEQSKKEQPWCVLNIWHEPQHSPNRILASETEQGLEHLSAVSLSADIICCYVTFVQRFEPSNWILTSCQLQRVISGQSNCHKQIHILKLFSSYINFFSNQSIKPVPVQT